MSKDKKFPIGYWCGPVKEEITDERFAQISECGLNCGCLITDYKTFVPKEICQKLLDVSAKNNIGYIVDDDRIADSLANKDGWEKGLEEMVAQYKQHKGLYQYFVLDEPDATHFEQLGKIVKKLKELDPAHNSFINLFPNYATPEQLKAKNYEEYVEKFIDEVKPPFVLYDHYHFLIPNDAQSNVKIDDERERLIYQAATKGKEEDRYGFFDNLEVVRASAFSHNLDFWITVLSVTHGRYRDLTEAEIRFEVYQSLAYGAKGILYFTYWSPKDDEVWHYHFAPMENDGTKTAHYDELTRVNKQLQIIGDFLLDKENLDVYHVGQECENVALFQPNSKFASIEGGNLTVGIYEDDFVLFANKQYKEDVVFKLKFPSLQNISKFNKNTGIIEKIADNKWEFSLELKAGDGDLYKIEEA